MKDGSGPEKNMQIESEEKFRRLFQMESDAIFLIDNETGDILEANDAACKLYGFSHDALIKMKHTDLSAEPDETRRVTLAGKTFIPVRWHRRQDQTVFPVEIVANHFLWQGYGVHIAAIRDITERVHREEEIRTGEERVRSLIDHNPDAVYSLDAEGTFLSVNESSCRISGYSREELIRMNFDSLIVAEEKQKVWTYFKRCLQGAPQHFETTILRKDGCRVIIHVTNTPMTAKGKVVGIYAIAKDINDHVVAERALEESEKKYRSLFDHSTDAILLTRPDGTVLDANPAACQMFGRSREEILETGRNRLVDHGDPRLYDALEKRTAHGGATAEITMIRANGERFPAEVTSTIFADEGGQQKTSMIIRDITERKHAEEALRERDVRYLKLFSHVPGMIYQFMRRPDGTYGLPYTTESIKDIFGCSPQDVREDYSPIAKVILPDDLKDVIRSIESSASSMSIWRCEFRVQIPGQAVRWILGHSTPEKLADDCIMWHGFITDITERNRQEEELRKSEASFQDLFNDAPVGYFEYDTQGRMSRVNNTFLEMLGYPPEEMIGQPVWKFIMDEKGEQQIMAKLEGTLAPFKSVERLYRRKNGTFFPVLIQDRLFHDEQGRIKGIRCTAQDMTDRKRAEEALAESEKQFRFLTEKMTDIVWTQDMNLKTIYVSPSIEAVLGFNPEERLSQDVREQLTPESMSVALDVLSKELAVEQQGQADPDRKLVIELEFRHKDGSTRWLENMISGIRDDRGVLIGLHGVSRDVTKRKKAEEALESEHRLLQSLINNIPDRIYAKDSKSRFIICNDAMIHRMGKTSMDELAGKSDFDLLPQEIALRFYEDEQEIIRSGKPMINREEPLEIEDGKITRWNLATKVPLLDKEGNITGIVGVGREITDLKKAQENLQAAREQLQQAEKLAALGRLSAGVAHEILNPVNIISMELQLLKAKGHLPQEAMKEFNICMDQIERIVRITKDLKQSSRVSSNKKAMADINDTIEHVLNLYASQLKIDTVETEVQYQPDLPKISMDKEKMEQVILNLIANAVDAMEGKEKKLLRIRTALEKTPEDSDDLKITVADNGTGILGEHMSIIFDPFFTTKDPGKGTGLGLAISYSIIHDHGGMIWADNNEWGGASFHVRLPVKIEV